MNFGNICLLQMHDLKSSFVDIIQIKKHKDEKRQLICCLLFGAQDET